MLREFNRNGVFVDPFALRVASRAGEVEVDRASTSSRRFSKAGYRMNGCSSRTAR